MNTTKLRLISPAFAAWAAFAAAALCTSIDTLAQSDPASKATPTSNENWGFGKLSKDLSADMIPLFEGLNQSRGTWSIKGEMTDGQSATPVQGNLSIQGNPKAGMIAMWKMDWSWPANKPEQMMMYIVMASPGKDQFDLRLIRIGPVDPSAQKKDPGIRRTMFTGAWSLENRTITWTESDLPGQPKEEDPPQKPQTFEMVVAEDGKITFQNDKNTPAGQWTNGNAIARTGKAPAEPRILTGKHRFKTAAEITDRRIKPCVPPQATDISLLSERGGHFAKYKISEADFKNFLDQLWQNKKDSSAHEREMMAGEGEPANRERMVRRFKAAGWEPLDNAVIYYSPSKSNGAMTTYYYDRNSGIVFHDRGYW